MNSLLLSFDLESKFIIVAKLSAWLSSDFEMISGMSFNDKESKNINRLRSIPETKSDNCMKMFSSDGMNR